MLDLLTSEDQRIALVNCSVKGSTLDVGAAFIQGGTTTDVYYVADESGLRGFWIDIPKAISHALDQKSYNVAFTIIDTLNYVQST